ncbi:MAG: hypothetical protein H0X21_04515 [Actinobacteria bacterium]|nr:hypothetical protein [Actinomycetota bacterium]
MANIQIRNVPSELHRTLKERAEKAGLSLQEYLLGEVTAIAETPTMAEVIARIRGDELFEFEETSAEAVAAVRRERDEELDLR